MRTPGHRFVAILVAFMMITAPAVAIADDSPDEDRETRVRVAERLVDLGDEPEDARASAARLTEADLAVLSAYPDMLQRAGESGDGRGNVGAQLVELGHEPAEAVALADRLTPEDVAVFLSNPEMLQRAGAMSEQTKAIIVAGLLVGGIVALAIAGSGSLSIN